MLIAVSFWGVGNFDQNRFLKNNLTQLVAQEITLNHNKLLNLDFNETNVLTLSSLMQKLDFQLVESGHISLRGLDVVGARYCSIQGNIAAQIRMKNEAGKLFTLYQTKLTHLLEESPEDDQTVGQVNVKQWQENGLFFGLAESIETAG